jgi:hypothetical protein
MGMIKKTRLTNKEMLFGTNGGWAAMRSVNYDGIATVYGIPYHQVSPIVVTHEWDDMIGWCVNTFGPSGTEKKPGVWSLNERWYANNAKFFFKDKSDCEWFMLRWS